MKLKFNISLQFFLVLKDSLNTKSQKSFEIFSLCANVKNLMYHQGCLFQFTFNFRLPFYIFCLIFEYVNMYIVPKLKPYTKMHSEK